MHRSVYALIAWCALCIQAGTATEYVLESERQLPLSATVDVLIVGGNAGGVAAALSAARAGASVIICTPNYGFSHEIADEGRCWLEPGEMPRGEFGRSLFGKRIDSAGYFFMAPGPLKKRVEGLFDEEGVSFFYGATGVGVLEAENGDIAGGIIADKAGRQAISAKVVIDATPFAGFARLAGAAAAAWPEDSVRISRAIYGAASGGAEEIGNFAVFSAKTVIPDGSWVERCRAEQLIRRLYPTGGAKWTSQMIHLEEQRAIIGQAAIDDTLWRDIDSLPLGVCRPDGVEYCYVLSGACAVSRPIASRLALPANLAALGERVGAAAADQALARQTPGGLRVRASEDSAAADGLDVVEYSDGIRPYRAAALIDQPAEALPVWGEYDVLVVGGGSSGAPAAISAARAGARTLVIEQLGFLGGTGTNGIGKFWKGYREGFAMEFGKTAWRSPEKAQWLFEQLDEAGGEVWFNTFACGALVEDSTVRGVVIATPFGRAAVRAAVVIDATGDGDIAVAAGARHVYVDARDLAVQEASFLSEGPNPDGYANEFNSVLADPLDVYSLTQFIAQTRAERHDFDYYPLVGQRESRTIVGEHVITVMDQYLQRTYEDMIAVANSDFDNHGYFNGIGVYAGIYPNGESYIPLRSLLPAGLRGILTIGRCKSATHDALPLVRMQADVANEGYAAGYIAANCAQDGIALRSVDIGAVQDHLASIGNITSAHRNDKCQDGPDIDEPALMAAAEDPDQPRHAAMLLSAPEQATGILRTAFYSDSSLAAAKLLGLLGDTAGAAFMADWLSDRQMSKGIPYTFSAFVDYKRGKVLKEEDEVIWALGMCRAQVAVDALCDYLRECPADNDYFSHLRALFLSLGRIGDPAAAPALAAFLQRDGVQGHTRLAGQEGALTREAIAPAFIELFAAAALYSCGDADGLGEMILQRYIQDWRGHLVRYAGAILEHGGVLESKKPLRLPSRGASAGRPPRIHFRNGAIHIGYYFPLRDRIRQVTIRDLAGRTVRTISSITDPIQGELLVRTPSARAYVVTVHTDHSEYSRCIAAW